MSPSVNSPFRYPGGKYYARKHIMKVIPQNYNTYIEPFAGGASIFFGKNKVKNNWLNDLDKELINCYKHIRDFPEELIQFLDGIPAKKELHTYYKKEFKPKDDLERAGRWFYLNRISYSGIMKFENCYWGYGEKYSMTPDRWPQRIRKTSAKLQNVKLTSWDFEKVIEKIALDCSNTHKPFLFIDPPYYNADQDKFYTCSFSHQDHIRLKNLLQKYKDKFKFLLTYDNTPEIYELYDWCIDILEREWNYTINRTDDQKKYKNEKKRKEKKNKKGQRYKGKEIFIVNFSQNKKQLALGV